MSIPKIFSFYQNLSNIYFNKYMKISSVLDCKETYFESLKEKLLYIISCKFQSGAGATFIDTMSFSLCSANQ